MGQNGLNAWLVVSPESAASPALDSRGKGQFMGMPIARGQEMGGRVLEGEVPGRRTRRSLSEAKQRWML